MFTALKAPRQCPFFLLVWTIKLIYIMFIASVITEQKTRRISIMKTNRLMLFTQQIVHNILLKV
jgi:hypothetical protein